MSRNIVIGIIIAGVVLAGAFLILRGKPSLIDTTLLDRDETELSALGNDVALLDQDNIILDELDQTFSDILDESAGVSAESALNLASLDEESSEADFSGDLNVLNGTILQELDQIFGEVSQ